MIEATLGIASILTMGLIAFNRYIRVVKQALYNRLFPSKRTAQLYRGVVWIASTFFARHYLSPSVQWRYHRRYAICNFAWKIEHMSYVLVIVGSVGTTQPQLQFFTATTKFIRFSKNLNVHGTDDAVASSRLPRPDIRVLKNQFHCRLCISNDVGTIECSCDMESAANVVPREVSTALIFLMFTSSLANPIIYICIYTGL